MHSVSPVITIVNPDRFVNYPNETPSRKSIAHMTLGNEHRTLRGRFDVERAVSFALCRASSASFRAAAIKQAKDDDRYRWSHV